MRFKNLTFDNDTMVELLNHLGFYSVTVRSNSFRFGWNQGDNPNGVALFMADCKYKDWSNESQGDIIDLIVAKLKCSIKEAFKILEDFTHTKIITVNTSNELSEIIERLECLNCQNIEYPTYDDSVVDKYEDCFSQLFLNDGVGVVAQSLFGVRYDSETERICFPIRDGVGKVCGILGRYNQRDLPKTMAKYLPLIPYKKHLFLYGLYENRAFIKDSIIIVESEKSVMRAFSLGHRNVLALGGNNLSDQQLNLVNELNPSRIIVALDEGLTDEHIIAVTNKLKSKNPFIKRMVGYLNSNHIGLGKKNCIFDEDKVRVERLLKEAIIWI